MSLFSRRRANSVKSSRQARRSSLSRTTRIETLESRQLMAADFTSNVAVNPSSFAVGDTVALTVRINNIGDVAANGRLAVYLSYDAVYDPGVDLFYIDTSNEAIDPGFSALGVINVKLVPPKGSSFYSGRGDGTYYILAVADQANAVAESNENNNVSVQAVTVTGTNTTPVLGSPSLSNINDKQTVSPFSSFTVTDPDDQTSDVTVTITNGVNRGDFSAGTSSWTRSVNGNDIVYTRAISGANVGDAIQNEIRSMVFTPRSNAITPNTTETTDFSISVNDNIASPVSGSAAVVGVLSINDAATISYFTGPFSVTEDVLPPPRTALVSIGELDSSDPDFGQNIRFQTTVTSAPGNLGTLQINQLGLYTYTVENSLVQYLKAGEQKVESFTVRSIDGTEFIISIPIKGANDAATITHESGSLSVTEDIGRNDNEELTATGKLKSVDTDASENGVFQTTVTPGAETLGTLVIDAAGNYQYTVSNEFTQYLRSVDSKDDVFTVKSIDGTEYQLIITVNGTDDVPTITLNGSSEVTEGQDLRGPYIVAAGYIVVNDPDERQAGFLSYTPATGTLGTLEASQDDGSYIYKVENSLVAYLNGGQTLVETFNVTTNDGTVVPIQFTIRGASSVATITHATGSLEVTEDENVNGGNLTASGSFTSVDSDAGQSGVFQTTVVPAAGNIGTLTIDAAGNYQYTVPNSAVQYLAGRVTKVDGFTIKSIDGTEQLVQITINGANDQANSTYSGTFKVDEDLNVDALGFLVDQGTVTVSDLDAGEATITLISGPATLGTATFDPVTGAFQYKVANTAVQFLKTGEEAVDVFQFQTGDGTIIHLSISIWGLDDPTTATPVVVALTETDAVQTTGGTLVVNDADAGQNSVQGFKDRVGQYGNFSISAAGVWTYEMTSAHNEFKAGVVYTDKFTVLSADGTSLIDVITINITGTNDKPTAQPGSFASFDGIHATGFLIGNDAENPVIGGNFNASGLTILIVSPPSNGIVGLVDHNEFVYTANSPLTSGDSFTFQVKDPEGALSEVVTVTIGVSIRAVLVGDKLTITGLESDDIIRVYSDGTPGLIVSSNYLINGLPSPQRFLGVNNLIVNSLGGQDSVTISAGLRLNSLAIDAGTGNDRVVLGNDPTVAANNNVQSTGFKNRQSLTVNGTVDVKAGTGNDSVYERSTLVRGAKTIDLGTGDNRYDVYWTVSEAATIKSGTGADTFQIGYWTGRGTSSFDSGAGNDLISLYGSRFNKVTSFVSGADQDSVALDVNIYDDALSVDLGAAADYLLFSRSIAFGKVSIVTGEGNDLLYIGKYITGVNSLGTTTYANGGSTIDQMTLDTGAGLDTSEMASNNIRLFFANYGEGRDEITVESNVFGESGLIDGGLQGAKLKSKGNVNLFFRNI